MNLTLYFRLIVAVLFQKHTSLSYKDLLFYCPRVIAKDGFNVSLQIHDGNYCSSEKGWGKLGHTWDSVEFGFPSQPDEEFKKYAEDSDDICNSFGNIPVNVLEEIFEKHGGIDWEKTISIEIFQTYTTIL